MKKYPQFPIKTETACQLKWSHSTVFLTELTTSSCHRVAHDKFDLDSFDFHNTPQKLNDRGLMLNGQWPGRGCEHCKNIEDAGGTSDRMLHLDFHGYRAPPEVDSDLTATKVTPRILEIYFSNVCNLKCIYCTPHFSSQIKQENTQFGRFYKDGVHIPSHFEIPEEFPEATNKMFTWLDSHVTTLDQLLVLGGEPFIQKETKRLLKFLADKGPLELNLALFSNLMVPHNKLVELVDTLKQLQLEQITIVASLDSVGSGAEYHRNGLDLNTFKKNFEYLLHNTDFTLNINSTLTVLSIPEMPALAELVNTWSKVRTVHWSMMKVAGKPFLHPTILGSQILDLGFNQSLEVYNTMGDPEKEKYIEYFRGIASEIASSERNDKLVAQMVTYLTELDRRRGTDFKKAFPEIVKLL